MFVGSHRGGTYRQWGRWFLEMYNDVQDKFERPQDFPDMGRAF